jgi:hypothetical protein
MITAQPPVWMSRAEAERIVRAASGGGEVVGYSTDGMPILLHRIGTGPRRVLLWAYPHPDEPVGLVTAAHLVAMVASTSGSDLTLGIIIINCSSFHIKECLICVLPGNTFVCGMIFTTAPGAWWTRILSRSIVNECGTLIIIISDCVE